MEVDEAVYSEIIKILAVGLFLFVIMAIFIVASTWYTEHIKETETRPQQCKDMCTASRASFVNYTKGYCHCLTNIGVKIQLEMK
jgi:hypothetical protein